MQVQHTQRGFEYVLMDNNVMLQQSSAIGDYADGLAKPGSSFLWYGYRDDLNRQHLNREAVRGMLESDIFDAALVPHVQAWLKTGSLEAGPEYKLTVIVPDVFDGTFEQWEDTYFTFSSDDVGERLKAIMAFCKNMGWNMGVRYIR